ncbi:hypothetical protein GTH52_03885 [Clostridium tyrobutyricum]|jgi:hypothetical protein|uniref:Uncharacterized protein n=2 Tax=Clostridium tyrobutyricum TaxID=1519 RepID=W6N2G2_CLOTY|nr:hypothetical protein [Clostridium tyrobutyricum]AIZ03704.1 hypothetical protein CTB_10930 [Clostridium tyrobutyricum]AND85000.1 hypothetical protein CTK_C17450 [Clostridium tyrobutyricum]ANP69565.1 hypothetical protein BA182_07740 [Clostridium tyrobutyricum]MBR9648478.1 hypothetical protein [Clostridium tyrobutyricum]MBV4414827.1 hypothetical protein [Clostridium tyrobutyricum]
MIAFKKMWDDVCDSLSNNQIENIKVIENFKSGFVIKDNINTYFITKQDFVDIWCNIVCLNEIGIKENLDKKYLYEYEILKTLPYIKENDGVLKLA